MKNGNCNILAHNSDFSEFIAHSLNFVSHNSKKKVRIARYIHKIVKNKLLFFSIHYCNLTIRSLHLAIRFFPHNGTKNKS